MQIRKPSPAFAVAVAALVVSLGGTSYAVGQIGSGDIRDNSVRSVDIRDGQVRAADLAPNAAGVGRWALINAAGKIEAQSGGFSVAAAYVTLPNTDPNGGDNSQRAAGNVYINANEDLLDNGVYAVVALQNQVDQNGDTITNGRAPGADNNPEFSGEISTTVCGLATVVACAPLGTNATTHLVVSPRNSDGTVTMPTARKRFYIFVTGDSSDLVVP